MPEAAAASALAGEVAKGAKDMLGESTNFNYYIKRKEPAADGTEKYEDITKRPFYQCPIFTTHNTFINHYGLSFGKGLSEEAVEDLDAFITHLVMLTNYFPICVEIDIKGIKESENCIAGHYKTKLEHKIKINKLCIKIIEEYYERPATLVRHPLILHLDIEKRQCLEFAELKEVYNKYESKAKLEELEEGFELSQTAYQKCKNKVIFREKIYGKKIESEEKPGMVKVKRRSSALAPKKTDFYFPLDNLETNGIPYITYKSSTGYHKGKFDFNLTTANQPFISCIFENQLEFHSRVFPGILPKKPQFKNSQEILNKTIDLFSAPNILYVPTLMAFNYKTPKPYKDKNGENPIILLAQKFCELYGTEPAEFNKLKPKLETSPYVTNVTNVNNTTDQTALADTDTESIYGDENSGEEVNMESLIDKAEQIFTKTPDATEIIIELDDDGHLKSINTADGTVTIKQATNDMGLQGGPPVERKGPTIGHFGGGSKKKKRVKKGKKISYR